MGDVGVLCKIGCTTGLTVLADQVAIPQTDPHTLAVGVFIGLA